MARGGTWDSIGPKGLHSRKNPSAWGEDKTAVFTTNCPPPEILLIARDQSDTFYMKSLREQFHRLDFF